MVLVDEVSDEPDTIGPNQAQRIEQIELELELELDSVSQCQSVSVRLKERPIH